MGWFDDVPVNGHTPSVSVVNSDEHSPWLQVELNADSHCVCNVWRMSARMCVRRLVCCLEASFSPRSRSVSFSQALFERSDSLGVCPLTGTSSNQPIDGDLL